MPITGGQYSSNGLVSKVWRKKKFLHQQLAFWEEYYTPHLSGDSRVRTKRRSREFSVCLKDGSAQVKQVSLHIDLSAMVASKDPSGLGLPILKQRLFRDLL